MASAENEDHTEGQPPVMFKKKPTIKNLAPLRSSDRRRIADQIINDYNISVPSNAPADTSGDDSTTPNQTLPNITAIRNSLLPENSLSARFTTTAGPQLREVQGTVYVGTHPEGEERVLWFKIEHGPGADGRLYPTVYTLWHNPNLVPLLHTPEMVMQKLRGGADLMTPGLADEPPFPERAVKGAIVAVAGLDRHTVPLFVGICEIDIAGLGEVQGTKGHAVRGIHWEGDEVWAWSSSSRPGQPAPEYLAGWDEEPSEPDVGEAAQKVNDLTLGEGQQAQTAEEPSQGEAPEQPEEAPAEVEKEPSTKEIDDVFEKAFLYSLYKLKNDNPSAPNHGLSLPVQPSAFVSNMITPFLPIHSTQQAQFYQIKKTSWKNVKKFIKYLDKQRLVKSKDRNGQETVILDVDFNDRRVEQFVPYRLPSKHAIENAGKPAPSGDKKPAGSGGDPAVGQTITVQTLYRPTTKLTPTIFPALSSGDPRNYYKYSEVSNRLDEYVQSQNPPLVSGENRRIISLNPFLANTVFTSSSAEDRSTVARGKTTRDGLLKRIVEDPAFLAPHYVILKQGQTLSDVKPKAGATPKANVVIERRTGSKTVTKVWGLEVFGIVPSLLAEELQKKCASSTSVTQATGATKGVMEVLIQGDQRRAVETALVRRGLRTQWIDVVDKTKKKK
ncbi:putative RNA binding protein Ligatin/Tma64 [Aspergillus clavatus NRRL 1]|uniref:RNA binding protein Ligatin/Tma64, putative n=1 Tax=Aspergillus clavatus (strain ATCC 1007 / CBS 513.65 / DSM 816 / NCTC 3887 / NRRL 1 / QM 1276 / 107) TaxID=344612 RepID=A1CPK4_ASPCL|nr:RNA binding protein Ligatin/Tma64, putative [Aspergillus clavatus NRRL 1]EAW07575.1 RNA binding protein Ligatin/Tma64, putative [Aspergillus clavatus NRRL 1]